MNTEIFTPKEAVEYQSSARLGRLIKDWFGGTAMPECEPTGSGGERKRYAGAGLRAVEPVIDFGCGDARYLRMLARYPFPRLIGVEGMREPTFQPPDRFGPELVQWDLAHPLWLGVKGNVMSIEVAEHLHAQHHDTYMDTLSRHCTGKLLLTWAVPGQGGLRHVSERTQPQVVAYVGKWGFKFLEEESNRWRAEAGQDLSWFAKSIYLFERLKVQV